MSARLLPHFILFAGFLYLTLNGIIILKTRYFTHPFNRKKQIEGSMAILVGLFFILFGLYCLWLLYMLISLNVP